MKPSRFAAPVLFLLAAAAFADEREDMLRMAAQHQHDKPTATPAATTEPAQEVTAEEVTYGEVAGHPLRGYLAKPKAHGGALPGLIVIHEWWGVNDNIRAMTRRLAGEGYLALAVDLYGGATAYNSVYDRDEGPVGGLAAPPPVPAGLLPFSLMLQAAGAAAAPIVGWPFTLVYLAMAGLGAAYSHPRVRFKARPWASLLVVSLGQGVLGFLLGFLAAGGAPRAALAPRALEAAFVAAAFTTALYPLTQLYQVDEDRRQVALHDVAVDAAKGFDARRCNLGVVEALAHEVTP